MKRKGRLIALLLLLCVSFSGCVSSKEKAQVRATVKTYFSALQTQDFVTANALTTACEDGIPSQIENNAVNALIFGQIAYELWGIERHDGVLQAHLMIDQISLAKAYEKTTREYNEFLQSVQQSNRVYSQDALETKWNEMLCRHVRESEDTVVYELRVPLVLQDGSLRLCMTADFRNALFGGELDAIKALETIRKGE